MTGSFAETARTRRIEALQAVHARRAGVASRAATLSAAQPSRFPPIDKVLAALTVQDPLRLMAT